MDNKDNGSGVGVLDKAALVLGALEAGPATLADLVTATRLARPTAHRLAVALEYHRLVARDSRGRFILGSRISELAAATTEDRLITLARPILKALCHHTNESVQLFKRQGEDRICITSIDRPSGLRDSIPTGAVLSMKTGSSAQILLAWEEPDQMHLGLQGASFNASQLAVIRRRGWAQSIGEREPGVTSVSAPVRGSDTHVLAAICVSGPVDRMGRQPGRVYGPAVVAAAHRLSEFIIRAEDNGQHIS